MSTIKDWQKGSGSFKVDEFVYDFGVEGNIITTFSGTTGITEVTGKGFIHSYVGGSGIKNIAAVKSSSAYTGIPGHNYVYSFTFTIISGSPEITTSAMGKAAKIVTPGENNYFIYGSNGQNGVYFSIQSSGDVVYSISDFKLIELPPLSTIHGGTKYLENITAGTAALQSKTAYGEWEFDFCKGADSNFYALALILDKIGTYSSAQGYFLIVSTDESISLRKSNNGSGGTLLESVSSYISNNTWYRIKVARLQSEGIFKDIPTLQVSNLVTMPATYTYDNFISNGRYGFSAERISVVRGIAGTADEISIVNAAKYLVEFDCQGIFTTSQTIRLKTEFNGTNQSDEKTFTVGRNSLILTATGTSTGVLEFKTEGICDYIISGLTIRRIYPANTFAVFIKGGIYNNIETGWTLVGTPTADSTYVTSENFVIDLDSGDKIANIEIRNGIKQ